MVHERAETVEFCMPHLMVTVTDQLVGVTSMWNIVLQITGGTWNKGSSILCASRSWSEMHVQFGQY